MSTERGVPRTSERLSELLSDRMKLDQEERVWGNRVSSYFLSVRTLNGMSQEEVASDLGVSQTYVSQIERGERVPSENILRKLESILVKESDGNKD